MTWVNLLRRCDKYMHQQTKASMVNSLWPSDAIWRHRSGSTLAQVMAWWLTAPSHYLNQCWLIMNGVLWYSPYNNFTGSARDINSWYEFENYNFEITATSPRGQWIKIMVCHMTTTKPLSEPMMVYCQLDHREQKLQWNLNRSTTVFIQGNGLKTVICIMVAILSWGLIQYKMPSYKYTKSHCGNKMVLWLSYLHSRASYTSKMTSSNENAVLD